MRSNPSRTTLRIDDTPPFGDVALPPKAPDGVLTQLMADALRHAQPDSDAQALMRLRRNVPQASLSARVAALAAMMRR